MVALIGVTGLAGAGKTTAMRYLSQLTGGELLYLGQVVLDEIDARGLDQTRENEKRIRVELRQQKGPAALAIPYQVRVSENLARGIPTFVDAIFVQDEFDVLTALVDRASSYVLAIDTPFDVRYERLIDRAERRFTRDQLADRDKTELELLGTGAVIAAANHMIRNDASRDDFYARLTDFLVWCSSKDEKPV